MSTTLERNQTPDRPLPGVQLAVDRIEHALAADARSAGFLALVIIGLPRGCSAEDAARSLDGHLRPYDTLAALNDCELVIVCPALEDHDAAQTLAGRVHHTLLSSGYPARVGTAFPRPGQDALSVLTAAASALASNESHAPGEELLDETSRARSRRRSRAEANLRQAVPGRLVLAYQPIIDLVTSEVPMVEALVRYRDEDGELVPASQFVDLARSSGLLPVVDLWVLTECCALLGEWASSTSMRRTSVSVNVSAATLTQPDFAVRLHELLVTHRAPAERLVIELQAEELSALDDDACTRLSWVHSQGVRIALDGFGSEHASVAAVQRVAPTVVKIDPGLLARAGGGGGADRTAAAVFNVASAMELMTVAPCIETPAQAEFVVRAGCDYAQGRLFSAPLMVSELTSALRSSPRPWGDAVERLSIIHG